ncbi:MAG: FAD binding domain-containing protein [Hyphomicrobiaceae bacterium]
MQPFEYSRPTTIAEALALLTATDAWPLAGGTDLITDLREGRCKARHVVDLKHIPELVSITREQAGGWHIGAAAPLSSLARHAEIANEHPGLAEAAGLVGSLQVQNRASLGGNLCTATPSGDTLPILFSLGAQVEIAGADGRRRVPISTIPTGPRRTSLAPSELVTGFILPQKPQRSAARYQRFTPRREMDIAIAGAASMLALSPDGTITDARITLASVAPVPLEARRAAAELIGARPSPELLVAAAATAAGETAPISDTRASADYRRHLSGVLTRRTLEACLADINRQGHAARA